MYLSYLVRYDCLAALFSGGLEDLEWFVGVSQPARHFQSSKFGESRQISRARLPKQDGHVDFIFGESETKFEKRRKISRKMTTL